MYIYFSGDSSGNGNSSRFPGNANLLVFFSRNISKSVIFLFTPMYRFLEFDIFCNNIISHFFPESKKHNHRYFINQTDFKRYWFPHSPSGKRPCSSYIPPSTRRDATGAPVLHAPITTPTCVLSVGSELGAAFPTFPIPFFRVCKSPQQRSIVLRVPVWCGIEYSEYSVVEGSNVSEITLGGKNKSPLSLRRHHPYTSKSPRNPQSSVQLTFGFQHR